MDGELCRLCGGDGRIGNALGGNTTATCPSCHGSGRRFDSSSLFRDVTKTKPSHFTKPSAAAGVPAGPKTPVTVEGTQLALEVNQSTVLPAETKLRLIAEIMMHESTHG